MTEIEHKRNRENRGIPEDGQKDAWEVEESDIRFKLSSEVAWRRRTSFSFWDVGQRRRSSVCFPWLSKLVGFHTSIWLPSIECLRFC